MFVFLALSTLYQNDRLSGANIPYITSLLHHGYYIILVVVVSSTGNVVLVVSAVVE